MTMLLPGCSCDCGSRRFICKTFTTRTTITSDKYTLYHRKDMEAPIVRWNGRSSDTTTPPEKTRELWLCAVCGKTFLDTGQ